MEGVILIFRPVILPECSKRKSSSAAAADRPATVRSRDLSPQRIFNSVAGGCASDRNFAPEAKLANFTQTGERTPSRNLIGSALFLVSAAYYLVVETITLIQISAPMMSTDIQGGQLGSGVRTLQASQDMVQLMKQLHAKEFSVANIRKAMSAVALEEEGL